MISLPYSYCPNTTLTCDCPGVQLEDGGRAAIWKDRHPIYLCLYGLVRFLHVLLSRFQSSKFLVGSLAIVGQPLAFRHFHVGEDGSEGRGLRATGVDTKANFPRCLMEMAHTHLPEGDPILRAFDTEILLSPAQAVPHGGDAGGNFGGGPVGIAVVGDHAAQVLKTLMFVLNGTFQPVLGVQIHHHAALVKAVGAFGKFGFHHKGEEGLVRSHLQHRGVVVAEVVVGSLPQIGVGQGDDLNAVLGDHSVFRGSGPL